MFVYGPVPSRRLGNSLGVSLIPSKACSYSCIYCQIGITDKYAITPVSYFDKNEILQEIEQTVNHTPVDYITFAGDGEPTLSSDLGWILRQCRRKFSIPTAVITNSSLIYQPEVAERLNEADLILPSIDAGSEATFKKINRPHKNLDFTTIIDGLIGFSKNSNPKIWTETMLVKNYNDTVEEIDKISAIIKQLHPEKSFVMVSTRPPQIDVKKPNPEIFLYAQKKISNLTTLDFNESGSFNIKNYKTLLEAIENISSRHPLRVTQAEKIAENFQETLDELLSNGTLITRTYEGEPYILPAKLTQIKNEVE